MDAGACAAGSRQWTASASAWTWMACGWTSPTTKSKARTWSPTGMRWVTRRSRSPARRRRIRKEAPASGGTDRPVRPATRHATARAGWRSRDESRLVDDRGIRGRREGCAARRDFRRARGSAGDGRQEALSRRGTRYPRRHRSGTGDYETFRRWEVIADDGEMESPDWQLRLMDAEDERPGAQVGEYIEQQIENPEFG